MRASFRGEVRYPRERVLEERELSMREGVLVEDAVWKEIRAL